jgi:hypothetical protein
MGLIKEFFQKPILQITKKFDSPAIRELQKGDVILFRTLKQDLIGASIGLFTASPYSHVEIYIDDGWGIGATVNGVGFDCAVAGKDLFGNLDSLDVLRYKGGLSEAQKQAVAYQALKQLAKPYDYAGLFTGFPWPSRKSFIARSSYRAFMCAEMADYCYSQAGLPLSPNAPTVVAPADIACSSVLDYKFSIYGGELRTDKAEVFNKVDPEVQKGRWNKLARFIVERIFDPTSHRDEFYEHLRRMSRKTSEDAKAAPSGH